MTQAKEDDIVRVHYTVKLDNDTIVGSTKSEEPVSFCDLFKHSVKLGSDTIEEGRGNSRPVLPKLLFHSSHPRSHGDL